MKLGRIGLALCAIALAAGVQAGQPKEPATLWHGGTIVTMDGEKPRTVDAVVELGGKIVFAGNAAKARRIAGRKAAERDLKGATMLPGFVDAHSHFAIALQLASGIDLSDPAIGPPADIPGMLGAIKQQVAARSIPEDQWVVVWQYNEEALAERRHVTRAELDSVLPRHKVVLVHVSVHGVVANSATLAAAGIDEATPVPEGGIMTRGPDGRLSGLLFEKAMFPVMLGLPQPTDAQKLAALEAAQLRYARGGYTHAQDGSTQPADVVFLTSAEAGRRMKIDLALLPNWMGLDALLARKDLRFGSYQGHVKLQGIKLLLDGSPQARTAYMTRDYARGAPDGHHPWHGQPVIKEEEYLAQARKVHGKGWQIFVHANGDAAIDMAIRSFDALGIKAADNRRPVVIHSQFQRPDQLAAYARIGVGPAYFSNHTHYFADTHRTNFSAEVVGFISPFKAARTAGLRPSNHSDFPVTALDPMTQLWSSMARTSLTGVVSGEDQRLTAYEGLQALTTGAAWQVFEENRKGRIKAGLLADFVVLDRNPLTTPVAQIRSIRVLETVKEGQTIWQR